MSPFTFVSLLLLAGATATAEADSDCVTFRSDGRLRAEAAFSAPLPHGLSLRLVPQAKDGPLLSGVWQITVTPAKGTTDYVWPVSPPFQTAPHLFIGQTYGWTAKESVAIQRNLRFVVDEHDYKSAVAATQRRDPDEVERSIAQFGRGTLRLTVTASSVVQAADASSHTPLEWIAFEGEACVARER